MEVPCQAGPELVEEAATELLLRATLTGSGPEACSSNPPLGVLSELRSGLVAIDLKGDPAFRSSLSGRPGLCLWKK